MARITAEQRREALRKRTKRGVNERGQKGLGQKSVLDFSKAGDRKIVKYQVKSGKDTNFIDILPFEITQPWYKDLKSVSGTSIGLDIGFTDYKLEVPIHYNVGENNDAFLCLKKAFGRKCPLCEEMYAEWDKDEQDQDAKKIQALKPRWRCFYNVYDYDGADAGFQLWEFSYFLFEEMLQEAMETEDDGIVTFSDLQEGSSIEFKGREKTLGKNKFYEAHSIAFKPRDAYSDDVLKETLPLDAMLIIPTYEQIAKCHLGMDAEDGEEQAEAASEPEETSTNTRSRSRQRPSSESEPEKDKAEDTPPWDECPISEKEFGSDCDPDGDPDCGSCDEDLFQACLAKQKGLADATSFKPRTEEKPTNTRGRSRAASAPKNDVKDSAKDSLPAAPRTRTRKAR